MKLRTRIGLLPISAAGVIVVGLLVTLLAGNRTLAGLQRHRDVLTPVVAVLEHIDRTSEQFRMTLQNATAEGDIEGLKAVEPIAASTAKAVAELAAIEGQREGAAALGNEFGSYRDAALAATRALLTKAPPGDSVVRMQKAQAAFETLQRGQMATAKESVAQSDHVSLDGVRQLMALNLGTGIVVLLVLGGASWMTVRSVWREIGAEPSDLRLASQRVAEGDLSVVVVAGNETSLAAGVASMIRRLRTTVGVIRGATESISTASSEIAIGNQDLSNRTEHTASSLQQTASSMSLITSTVQQSADSAQQAHQLASAAADAAQRGGRVMDDVVANMTDIGAASRKIGEITSVIDGIAFQTNILALNAAVEAARAGEQGRGFAVVASEVRSLAKRCADAAREIKTLIGASGAKVEAGNKLVQGAGTAMQDIVAGVARVSQIIGEISAASAGQSSGIAEVNKAVAELEQMTQQNAALVEQSAAAAGSLKMQAGSLAESVSAFRLESGNGGRLDEAPGLR